MAPWLRESLVRSLGDAGAAAFVLGVGHACGGSACSSRRGSGCVARAPARRQYREPRSSSARRALCHPHAARRRSREGRGVPRRGDRDQEEGAQLIALSLGAEPGEIVLDACAGRGNKAALLAEAVGSSGAVHAADQHPQKLARLVTELARMRVSVRATFAVDWTVGPGDVPMTSTGSWSTRLARGWGTLRRRPELATRRERRALADLCGDFRPKSWSPPPSAPKWAAPSCTRCAASCARNAKTSSSARSLGHPGSHLPHLPARSSASSQATPHVLRLTPHEHGTDGYFLASLVRRDNPLHPA